MNEERGIVPSVGSKKTDGAKPSMEKDEGSSEATRLEGAYRARWEVGENESRVTVSSQIIEGLESEDKELQYSAKFPVVKV